MFFFRLNVWAKCIGREDIPNKRNPDNYRVCAIHFTSTMFVNKRLNSEAVPTLYLPTSFVNSQPENSENSQSSSSADFQSKCNKEVQDDKPTVTKIDCMKPRVDEVLSASTVTKTQFVCKKCLAREKLPITQHIPTTSVATQTQFTDQEQLSEHEHISYSSVSNETDHDFEHTVLPTQTFSTHAKNKRSGEQTTKDLASTTIKRKLSHESEKKRKKSENDLRHLLSKQDQTKSISSMTIKLEENFTDIKIKKIKEESDEEHTMANESSASMDKKSKTKTKLDEKCQYSVIKERSEDSVEKKIKSDELQILHTKKISKNSFLNKFLKWVQELKSKYRGNGYDKELKFFALNLYFSCPQTYRFLEKTLILPSTKTLLRMKINFKPGVSDDLISLLSKRLKNNSPNYKYCTICIDEMVLRKNLYYDIHNDEIIGFHEIDGKKFKDIAGNAFVMLLRGCIENYKQPLGYAFTATNKNHAEQSNWLNKIIRKLTDAGFVVCAVVSNQGSNFVNFAKSKGVSAENPYFTVDGRKVFYIFDVPHLFKSIRDNLLTCNFLYDGQKLASWEHVEAFYNRDKQRNIRMVPKLTDAHLDPNQFQRLNVRYAAQVLSYSVAAGMSSEIELGILPAEAQETVDFIVKVDQLFDVLNSSKVSDPNKYKRAFSGTVYQVECLKRSLETFKNLKASSGKNTANVIKVFTGLQITINAILHLLDYFVSQGQIFFFTRRFNQDPIENIFRAIRQRRENSREPTPIQFKRAFSNLAFSYLFKNSPSTNCEDLDSFFLFKSDIDENTLFKNQISPRASSSLCVHTTDYRMELPAQNAFTYVCSYLLKKCCNLHDCPAFSQFINSSEGDAKNNQLLVKCNAFNKSKTFGNLILPPEEFVNYIEEFENIFLKNIEKSLFDIGAGKKLLDLFETVEHQQPCPCFPVEYLMKLYIRMRIYYAIQLNNRKIKRTSVKIVYLNVKHL